METDFNLYIHHQGGRSSSSSVCLNAMLKHWKGNHRLPWNNYGSKNWTGSFCSQRTPTNHIFGDLNMQLFWSFLRVDARSLLSSVAFWTSQGRVQEFKKLRTIFISLQTEKSTIQELFRKILTPYIFDSDKTGIPFCLLLTSWPSFWSFSQKSCCTCLYSCLLNTGNHGHKKVKQWRLIKGAITFMTAWLNENKGLILLQFRELPWISEQVLSFLLLLWLFCSFYVYAASLSSLSAASVRFLFTVLQQHLLHIN